LRVPRPEGLGYYLSALRACTLARDVVNRYPDLPAPAPHPAGKRD
jgi:hypothetical protein